jgi:hypothetical protein
MTTIQIVRTLKRISAVFGSEKAAPILGLTVKAFTELRRNL